MNPRPCPRVVLVDIEGTTTPIAFVHDVLFPYARARLAAFCAAHANEPEVAAALGAARALEGDATEDLARTTDRLIAWSDADRKAPPLKTLQGLIWRQGYRDGALRGQVYPDAAVHLALWHRHGLRLAVYSSGSEEAQRLIFRHSDRGDLAVLFEAFFDTRVGPKRATASYRAITQHLATPAEDILFLSDHPDELTAARAAGLATLRIDRALAPGATATDPDGTPVAATFDTVAAHFALPTQGRC